jgi:uncharacterized protein (DUF4415 family)
MFVCTISYIQLMTAKKKLRKQHRIMELRASADDEAPLREESVRGYYKPLKKAVTLRLDADVVAWFKKQGPRYQTRINRALRKLMIEGKSKAGE